MRTGGRRGPPPEPSSPVSPAESARTRSSKRPSADSDADSASPEKRARPASEPLEEVVTAASLGATPQGRLDRALQRAQRNPVYTSEPKPKAKRKKRVWLKKGQVDPNDPVAVAKQKERFAAIDEALLDLDEQYKQVENGTHHQLVALWNELDRRHDILRMQSSKRQQAAEDEIESSQNWADRSAEDTWREQVRLLDHELGFGAASKKNRVAREKSSLDRVYPTFIIPASAERPPLWMFNPHQLYSQSTRPLAPTVVDGTERWRAEASIRPTPLDPDDIRKDTWKLNIRVPPPFKKWSARVPHPRGAGVDMAGSGLFANQDPEPKVRRRENWSIEPMSDVPPPPISYYRNAMWDIFSDAERQIQKRDKAAAVGTAASSSPAIQPAAHAPRPLPRRVKIPPCRDPHCVVHGVPAGQAPKPDETPTATPSAAPPGLTRNVKSIRVTQTDPAAVPSAPLATSSKAANTARDHTDIEPKPPIHPAIEPVLKTTTTPIAGPTTSTSTPATASAVAPKAAAAPTSTATFPAVNASASTGVIAPSRPSVPVLPATTSKSTPASTSNTSAVVQASAASTPKVPIASTPFPPIKSAPAIAVAPGRPASTTTPRVTAPAPASTTPQETPKRVATPTPAPLPAAASATRDTLAEVPVSATSTGSKAASHNAFSCNNPKCKHHSATPDPSKFVLGSMQYPRPQTTYQAKRKGIEIEPLEYKRQFVGWDNQIVTCQTLLQYEVLIEADKRVRQRTEGVNWDKNVHPESTYTTFDGRVVKVLSRDAALTLSRAHDRLAEMIKEGCTNKSEWRQVKDQHQADKRTKQEETLRQQREREAKIRLEWERDREEREERERERRRATGEVLLKPVGFGAMPPTYMKAVAPASTTAPTLTTGGPISSGSRNGIDTASSSPSTSGFGSRPAFGSSLGGVGGFGSKAVNGFTSVPPRHAGGSSGLRSAPLGPSVFGATSAEKGSGLGGEAGKTIWDQELAAGDTPLPKSKGLFGWGKGFGGPDDVAET